MLPLLLLAVVQQRSVAFAVHVQVMQGCTLSVSGSRCAGAREPAPVVTREGQYIVYSF